MWKSYLPARFNTSFVIIAIFMLSFKFYKALVVLTLVYLIFYFLLRKKIYNFYHKSINTDGIIFSPVNGIIEQIEHDQSHGLYGDHLTKIQISISWWREMGVSLPFTCEVKNLFKDGKEIRLALESVGGGEIFGLSFYKRKFGFWPKLMITPGDRGFTRVNFGYFPFGGRVVLYLPKNYEILIKINEEVRAFKTIFAVTSENS